MLARVWLIPVLASAAAIPFAVAVPISAAQQPPSAAATPLVFDHVTVIDVEHGKRLPDQRVVIAGPRIQAVGRRRAVKLPKGSQVVDARGKYLIPGLWDLHTHSRHLAHLFYPLFLAHGVTGIRDAWSDLPLDTLVRWRRDILAGTRVGPPRQLLVGAAIDDEEDCTRTTLTMHVCVAPNDTADARAVVEALKAAGADMIKTYGLGRETYFAIAAAARRAGLPFGGHLYGATPLEASDSGARLLDHLADAKMQEYCWHNAVAGQGSSLERCQQVAERFRRNGTWWVPTMMGNAALTNWKVKSPRLRPVTERLRKLTSAFWSDSIAPDLTAGFGPVRSPPMPFDSTADSLGYLEFVQRAGLPILTGTDAFTDYLASMLPGLALHAELAAYVVEGLTPLNALQAATLNPAKMLRATDSLGTVARGKLADLVLLDADPLADIGNTSKIRAVVANGRYFDRAALDGLLAEVRAKVPEEAREDRGAR